MDVVIYHNPKCSKSRQTLDLLISKDISPKIIEYLQHPLDQATLRNILDRLALSPRDLMRKGEAEYRNNNLEDPSLSDDELIAAIIKYPILLQRPIVLSKDKAAIGRPPENVLDIL